MLSGQDHEVAIQVIMGVTSEDSTFISQLSSLLVDVRSNRL